MLNVELVGFADVELFNYELIDNSKFNIQHSKLELRHGTARRTRNNHFNHSQHIQCHFLPVNLHTRSL